MTVNSFQQHFRLARDGVLSSEAWIDVETGQRWRSHPPGFGHLGKQWRVEAYSEQCRNYMDGLIRAGKAAG